MRCLMTLLSVFDPFAFNRTIIGEGALMHSPYTRDEDFVRTGTPRLAVPQVLLSSNQRDS
jgi:hypothetical protein